MAKTPRSTEDGIGEGEEVHGREILETEGGVGSKKQEENGVVFSTAVCIDETVV